MGQFHTYIEKSRINTDLQMNVLLWCCAACTVNYVHRLQNEKSVIAYSNDSLNQILFMIVIFIRSTVKIQANSG